MRIFMLQNNASRFKNTYQRHARLRSQDHGESFLLNPPNNVTNLTHLKTIFIID